MFSIHILYNNYVDRTTWVVVGFLDPCKRRGGCDVGDIGDTY